jgi:hypothetical protein
MKKKLYLISSNGQYKIGITKREVSERIKDFKTGNCNEFDIVYVYESKYTHSIENAIHKHFKHLEKHISREWFDLSEEDIMEFPELCEKLFKRFELLSETNTFLQDKGKLFK